MSVTTQFTAAPQADEKIEPVSKRVLEQAFFISGFHWIQF